MNIAKAPYHMLYIDPPTYIRRNVLPVTRNCHHCESTMVIESPNDLVAKRTRGTWHLAFTCMVCNKTVPLFKPSNELQEKHKNNMQYAQMSDEEYEEAQKQSVRDQYQVYNRYIPHGNGSLRLTEFNVWNTRELRNKYSSYEEYVIETYVPDVLPNEKPVADGLIAEYERVLPYYVKQAKAQSNLAKIPNLSVQKAHAMIILMSLLVVAPILAAVFIDLLYLFVLPALPVAFALLSEWVHNQPD